MKPPKTDKKSSYFDS